MTPHASGDRPPIKYVMVLQNWRNSWSGRRRTCWPIWASPGALDAAFIHKFDQTDEQGNQTLLPFKRALLNYEIWVSNIHKCENYE